MAFGIIDEKTLLRKQYLKIRNSLDGSYRALATQQIIAHLLQLDFVIAASSIAGYYAIKNEVDLCEFYLQANAQNRQILLPVRQAGISVMRFMPWVQHLKTNIAVDLQTVETIVQHKESASNQESAISCPQVILVPGLAFDKQNYRLGYGKGCYDATIQHLQAQGLTFVTLGIGFSVQLTDELPASNQDQPLDYVLTENGLYS